MNNNNHVNAETRFIHLMKKPQPLNTHMINQRDSERRVQQSHPFN